MTDDNGAAELELAIDHISLSVADLARARAFFAAALAPLGLAICAEFGPEITGDIGVVGFGRGRKGSLWLAASGQQRPSTHICFRAKSRAQVRAFYQAALAAGGRDNGGPGIRAIYHPAYYAAFVLDPEGHNIEAVCFEPEG